MRHICVLLCIISLAVGCTSPIEAESIDLPVDAAAPEPELPRYEHQPEAAPLPVDPKTQPRLRVHSHEDFVEDGYDGRFCDYEVEATGFPAVDERGVVVDVNSYTSPGGEGEDEILYLNYYALAEAPPDEIVFNRGGDVDWDDEAQTKRRGCEPIVAEVRAHVDELNAALAQRRWRALERLDLIGDREHDYETVGDYDVESLPLAQRPVEMLYNSRKLILRIRASRVLLSLDKPTWSVDDEPYRACSKKPHPRSLMVDRRSRLGLVNYDYNNGGCLCDDGNHQALIEVPAELFTEVDARPSSAALVDAD